MNVKIPIFLILIFSWLSSQAQNDISISATLIPESKSLSVEEEVVYKNTSTEILNEIYFFDWANSFSSKTTPLGKRFSENYESSFHFEKDKDRGKTDIISVANKDLNSLKWERGNEVDILKVILDKPLSPNESYTIKFTFNVKIPDDKFTRFGVTEDNDFKLQYWYLSPAVYSEKWEVYSNKNVEDLYLAPSNFNVQFNLPKEYFVNSDLDLVSDEIQATNRIVKLAGEKRMHSDFFLQQIQDFEAIETDQFTIVTNIHDKKVNDPMRALLIDRVVHFLSERLGPYPFKKMMVTNEDYKKNPVYGLNLLPDFISPFPDGFEYDLALLKAISQNYIENTLPLQPRDDYWLQGSLQIYMMMKYVDANYPKMKIIGSLSDWWIIRWAHAADLEFNDQYPILYLNMARNNIQQSLTSPRDSLLKYNTNIGSSYYGGSGLNYLGDYLGDGVLDKSIKQFYSENALKLTKSSELETVLEQNTTLPVNWFFEDYISERTTIDFKISKVKKRGDSLDVTVRNLRKTVLPVSIYGKNKNKTLFKKWVLPIDSIAIVTVPSKDVRKLVLNNEGKIAEYNRRNNTKAIQGLLNRPLQFRLFQDVEDPDYNQLFFMPIFEYNLYDGISVGTKLYNKTVLPKPISYKLEPQYGLRSHTLIGSGGISYTQTMDKGNLYAMRYGVSGNYYSYDENLFYTKLTPYMTFAFRNKDIRDNEQQFINLRNVYVQRDENPADTRQEPSYNVFDAQYVYSNPNLINYFRGVVDYQISQKFSKISTTFEYRKLFLNNRQLNLRAYAGAFIYNDTRQNEDYFSFALDRPSDYLFEYGYYGRSEDTGLFSQQLIVAEGGFKSQLQPAFANSWIATLNASTNIWRWIFGYADVGLVHNKGRGTNAVYDTGIKLTLVADYFELYFPMYSNLGWEPGLPNYDQKIRFIVTLSPSTLLRLFTRRWY